MQGSFNIRSIKSSDLDFINKWYEVREKASPSKKLLPNTGYIVYDVSSEEPIAAMWIYYTNSPIAMFEELITDPKSDRKNRDLAIDELLNFCTEMVKLKGYEVIMALSNNTMLMNRLKRHKYDLVSDNLLQYVKIVNGGN